jgi:hypothetical protein
MPKGKGLAKIYRFNQKKLAKRYKFIQEELKVVPKKKGLAKK